MSAGTGLSGVEFVPTFSKLIATQGFLAVCEFNDVQDLSLHHR